MKQLLSIALILFFTATAYAQIDEYSKHILDSLGIKFDPNDSDALQKIEQRLKDAFTTKFDSAMTVAGTEVMDPNNIEGLMAEIRDELNEDDTTSTTYEFMQELPFLLINLDHPDPRYLTENGFELPAKLDLLFISGNGKSVPVDLISLFTTLSSKNIRDLYLTKDEEGISEIPEAIGSLHNLRKLGLYGNSITQLPDSIGELNQLEVLYLDGNPIQELPETISGLKELKILGIVGTQISAEEQSRIQKQLPNCKILVK
jgi:hypothetical protein